MLQYHHQIGGNAIHLKCSIEISRVYKVSKHDNHIDNISNTSEVPSGYTWKN